jgi:hypothetical protein
MIPDLTRPPGFRAAVFLFSAAFGLVPRKVLKIRLFDSEPRMHCGDRPLLQRPKKEEIKNYVDR